jgi:hypothetical protein
VGTDIDLEIVEDVYGHWGPLLLGRLITSPIPRRRARPKASIRVGGGTASALSARWRPEPWAMVLDPGSHPCILRHVWR